MAVKATTEIDNHVGVRVRMRRAQLGMSQEALARAVGVSFQQVQKYERGTNRIGASRLHQIAEALRVPITYFYEGRDTYQTDAGTTDTAALLTRRDSIDLLMAFSRIEDAQSRRLIVAMAERFADLAKPD